MTTDADADPVAAVAAPYIEHLNDEHGDWNVVLAKAFGGARDARRATVVGLDREGLDLEVDGDATRLVRVTFPAAIADESQLQRFGVELAREGRRLIGQDAPTRMERETAERATIRTFVTSVLRTEMVTRGVRQITFGGGDLATFEPLAADDFVYVLAPPPGRAALTVDASFTWEQFAAMAPAEQPVGAYYTVRRWRPTTAEMDVLFVLHGVGDEPAAGAGGAAARWAAAAQTGDPVALWGPRRAYAPPPETDWYLLVADDTGLPGAAAIIESLPWGTPVELVAEVDAEDDRQPLPDNGGLRVHWRYRRGAAAGTTTALADTVRDLSFPAGTPYAWGGAESRVVTAVRRHLRDERGLPQSAVSMTGYWRRDAH